MLLGIDRIITDGFAEEDTDLTRARNPSREI